VGDFTPRESGTLVNSTNTPDVPLETVIEKPSLESADKFQDDGTDRIITAPEEKKPDPVSVIEQQNTDRT
jgi:hypothetical protein